ncbi:MAG: hypothetical protein KGJ36_08750, partial [Acidobacteriota bacterium]|nr:hypothetical protein [Acidobacteriota bacterium]
MNGAAVSEARSHIGATARLAGSVGALGGVAMAAVALSDAPRAGHAAAWAAVASSILAWSIAALAYRRRAPRLGLLCAAISLGAGAAMVTARLGDTRGLGVHGTARDLAVVATLLTMAATVHLTLGLPDGELTQRGRRVAAVALYGAGLVGGLYLAATSRGLAPWPVAIAWAAALGAAMVALRARYALAPALGRQRIQSLMCGVALGAMVVVVVA